MGYRMVSYFLNSVTAAGGAAKTMLEALKGQG
jgi:hypothetical protein